MSEKYKVIDSTVPTFVTITIVDWVDLFIRPIYCKIIDDPGPQRVPMKSSAPERSELTK